MKTLPILILMFVASIAEAKVVATLHITDAQWTFLRRSANPVGDQTVDGTLAVIGTELTSDNVVRAARAALGSGLIKVSLSNDAHFSEELRDASQNGEFHAPFNFPPHGMRGVQGPDGDRLIFELEQLIPANQQLVVPAHAPRDDRLELVPFYTGRIDPKATDQVVRFEKNGVGSYSVFVNPRYREYLSIVDPKKELPHFHLGWCSDFCTYFAAKGELELGYKVYILIDAIAGVFPKKTGMALRELMALGAVFMTTAEYEDLVGEWAQKQMNAEQVRRSLERWERNSPTQSRVAGELSLPRYSDLAPGEIEAHGQCAVLLGRGE